MSFKPPAGVSGWDLPHLKIGATASRIIQDGALTLKCVGKWGDAAQGVDVISWRSWRWDGVGQAGVLEVQCVWCGCGSLEAGCNQSVWVPSDRAQSVGLGVLVAGSSQSM